MAVERKYLSDMTKVRGREISLRAHDLQSQIPAVWKPGEDRGLVEMVYKYNLTATEAMFFPDNILRAISLVGTFEEIRTTLEAAVQNLIPVPISYEPHELADLGSVSQVLKQWRVNGVDTIALFEFADMRGSVSLGWCLVKPKVGD